jgi:hypothetical protein
MSKIENQKKIDFLKAAKNQAIKSGDRKLAKSIQAKIDKIK